MTADTYIVRYCDAKGKVHGRATRQGAFSIPQKTKWQGESYTLYSVSAKMREIEYRLTVEVG